MGPGPKAVVGGLGLLVLLVVAPLLGAGLEVAMPASKTLVVYYSRTGTTQLVARSIGQRLMADVEPLRDTVHREGLWGFMRSLKDAIKKTGTTLEPLSVDPTAYDLVIIGTPDWGKSIAAPARTFLQEHRGRLHNVAFFLTNGTADHAAIFREMALLVGREPLATLGIPRTEVEAGRYEGEVQVFVNTLLRTGIPAPRHAVTPPGTPQGL